VNKSITPSTKGAIGRPSANNTTRKKPRPATERPLKIDSNLEHEILKRFPSQDSQYVAFAKLLIKRRELLTGKANPFAGVNLSDVANKLINPRIKDLGIRVDCRIPEEKILNRYGHRSGQMYWGFYPL